MKFKIIHEMQFFLQRHRFIAIMLFWVSAYANANKCSVHPYGALPTEFGCQPRGK